MKSPLYLVPGSLEAFKALAAVAEKCEIPRRTLELIRLRASQINGCGLCIDLHCHVLKREGESDERIFAVAAWRDAPWFTDAERAALALTEAATRMADRADPVPDEIWREAARHFDESALASLVLNISFINFINRMNVTTRQVAGSFRG
jgi:AhpD family alkylhydroperoxidase